jgi:hypothetical protein
MNHNTLVVIFSTLKATPLYPGGIQFHVPWWQAETIPFDHNAARAVVILFYLHTLTSSILR